VINAAIYLKQPGKQQYSSMAP